MGRCGLQCISCLNSHPKGTRILSADREMERMKPFVGSPLQGVSAAACRLCSDGFLFSKDHSRKLYYSCTTITTSSRTFHHPRSRSCQSSLCFLFRAFHINGLCQHSHSICQWFSWLSNVPLVDRVLLIHRVGV